MTKEKIFEINGNLANIINYTNFEITICQVRNRFIALFGEEVFKQILAKVEEEVKAYTLSGLMRHEYTRSPHKLSVTSINKI